LDLSWLGDCLSCCSDLGGCCDSCGDICSGCGDGLVGCCELFFECLTGLLSWFLFPVNNKFTSRTPFGLLLSFQTCQWLQEVGVTSMSHSGLMSNYCPSLKLARSLPVERFLLESRLQKTLKLEDQWRLCLSLGQINRHSTQAGGRYDSMMWNFALGSWGCSEHNLLNR
jgi:hypothetical protein